MDQSSKDDAHQPPTDRAGAGSRSGHRQKQQQTPRGDAKHGLGEELNALEQSVLTCRPLDFTCRPLDFTCRPLDFTCRRLDFTCLTRSRAQKVGPY